MSVLQLRLDKQLERILTADAREQERTPAEHARYILRRWLTDRRGEVSQGVRDAAGH